MSTIRIGQNRLLRIILTYKLFCEYGPIFATSFFSHSFTRLKNSLVYHSIRRGFCQHALSANAREEALVQALIMLSKQMGTEK